MTDHSITANFIVDTSPQAKAGSDEERILSEMTKAIGGNAIYASILAGQIRRALLAMQKAEFNIVRDSLEESRDKD